MVRGDPLAELLDPVTPAEFVAESWQRAPRFIRGTPEKAARCFDLERFYAALGSPRVAAEAAPTLVAATSDEQGQHWQVRIDARQISSALRAQMTVQAEFLERTDHELARLLDALKRSLGLAAAMNVGAFLSPDGHGYRFHYDTTQMWVVQIEGRKRWWYAPRPAIDNPVRHMIYNEGDRLDGEAPSEANTIERVLEPGDVLYLPAGVWHRAQAVGRSFHICLSVFPSRVFDFVAKVARSILERSVEWRRMPSGLGLGGGEVEQVFSDRLAELRRLLDSGELTAAALAQAWRRDLELSGVPPSPVPDLIGWDDRLRRVAPIELAEEEDELLLRQGGVVRARLPAGARLVIEGLARQESFRLADAVGWDAEVGADELEALFRGLIELGILARD